MRRLRRDEQGAVLAIVAIMLIAILGFVVIVVDVGGLLVTRRSLVRASDSAALAAAQSYILKQGAAAQGQADTYAADNTPGATRLGYAATSGIGGCTKTDFSCGRVTVKYGKNQELFFAPILGLNSLEDVAHTSSAIWGPTGSGVAVIPLVAAAKGFTDDCKVPDAAEGAGCEFYYSADDVGGNLSSFGWMNLNTNGWDVSASQNCSNSGSDGKYWLDNPVTNLDPLNWPAATYVCSDSGLVDTDWARLSEMADAHVIVSFPVSDDVLGSYSSANGGVGPHGLLPTVNGVDKYDVLGFVNLKLIALYDGDNPLVQGQPAIPGTSPQSGPCLDTWNAKNNPTVFAYNFSGSGCPGGTIPDTITEGTTPSLVYTVDNKGVKTAKTKCPPGSVTNCDYVWSPTLFSLTWVKGQGPTDAQVQFTWNKAGTAPIPAVNGACGAHFLGKHQDKCLLTEWSGFTVLSGGDPGSGADFGIRALRLAQ